MPKNAVSRIAKSILAAMPFVGSPESTTTEPLPLMERALLAITALDAIAQARGQATLDDALGVAAMWATDEEDAASLMFLMGHYLGATTS